MTDIPALLAELKAAAEKIGPQQWDVEYGELGDGPDRRAYALLRRSEDEAYTGIETAEVHCIDGAPIMDYIALANPANLLAIAAYVEALEKALEPLAKLADAVDAWGHHDNDTCNHRLTASDLRRARKLIGDRRS